MTASARAALCALLLGCASQAAEAGGRAQPIELDLVTAQGRPLHLHELRGRPSLLFVFNLPHSSGLATAIGLVLLSAPPQMHTSASPRAMVRKASPIAR